MKKHSPTSSRRHTPSAGFFLSTMRICLLVTCVVSGPSQMLPAQHGYREIEVKNGGTVSGTVRLRGPAPQTDQMTVTKDNALCGKTKMSPRLELGKGKGVKNAVVYLEGVTEGKKIDRSGTITVTQDKCEYSPHVTILPQGARLEISNSDPILHNVHAYDVAHGAQTAFNIAQPIKGQKTTVREAALMKCGDQISLTCDAGHPWMNGYIFTASQPYYAVTDKDGRFSMDDVPPGTYKLVMWHEGVAVARKDIEEGKVKKYIFEEPYKVEKEISISGGGNTSVELELVLR
jgi:hypothetical protein